MAYDSSYGLPTPVYSGQLGKAYPAAGATALAAPVSRIEDIRVGVPGVPDVTFTRDQLDTIQRGLSAALAEWEKKAADFKNWPLPCLTRVVRKSGTDIYGGSYKEGVVLTGSLQQSYARGHGTSGEVTVAFSNGSGTTYPNWQAFHQNWEAVK